ncbi:MAG: hypothetical protein ACR2HP_11795 [Ilumatobacteraceae bacterium]
MSGVDGAIFADVGTAAMWSYLIIAFGLLTPPRTGGGVPRSVRLPCSLW